MFLNQRDFDPYRPWSRAQIALLREGDEPSHDATGRDSTSTSSLPLYRAKAAKAKKVRKAKKAMRRLQLRGGKGK